MFTGIIENTGIVKEVIINGTNKTFWVTSPLCNELKIDQSLSHSGVCLTVEEIKEGLHRVTTIEETILKTNVGHWQAGTVVNLERCMLLNGRLDGHIVQGHVDTVGECVEIVEKKGSWEFTIAFDEKFAALVIEKGSISLNGISLTIFNITKSSFTVAIIPYTYQHTTMHLLKVGNFVNIEFDIIGKYVNRREILSNAIF